MKFNHLLVTLLLGFFIIILPQRIMAQLTNENPEMVATPSTLVGFGFGINDYGLGGGVELPIAKKITLYGNIGIGGWGWKVGGGLSFYPQQMLYKSSISLGYSVAMGGKGLEEELEVEPSGQSQKVVLDLNKVGTVNLIYSYNIKIGRYSKFVVSTGYAIPVTSNAYEVKSPGVTLTESSKQIISVMQPGGLIFGLKFMFGM